ncbi:iron-containing alcohol dehydrogenase [Candidatus Halobeggiatoa sp. HSG11]|nr:iron-containing alcohol dehydrogenase [Candidatus Halobeggiatoa sp. HSG11]
MNETSNSSINLELRKFVAPEFIFGTEARKMAGRYAQQLGGRKALIVTDPGVIKVGWTQEVGDSLENAGIPFTLYSNVSPNPRDGEVMRGAEFYRQEGCNVIVAVGGGSVLDCAKGIGIVSTNGGNILKYEGVDQVKIPMPPLICVPTTGGTSADVSQFAIINNTKELIKIAIISKAVVPDVALIDPMTLITMDPYLSACTGMDALVHAIEAFVSNASSPFTDVHALEGIRLISSNLIKSVQTPDDIELRGKIMLGSLEAGLAFSNASLGGVHAMAHSLGGFKDLPHGECNAMLLRFVMDFNFNVAPEKYLRIGEAMGLDLRGMTMNHKRAKILKQIEHIARAVGINKTLGISGVRSVDVSQLASKAIKDPCIVTNPRHPKKRDIEVIYEEAL